MVLLIPPCWLYSAATSYCLRPSGECVRSLQAMEREDSKDKPADKDDTKDSKKQQQKPVSRGGGEEGGITTWSTYGGDHQDGSEEQDTASASSKKADGKRHRPGWVKKIALKPKKVPSLTDSTSSLTRDVRHDPMHAVAESGLDSEPGEWEGSCEVMAMVMVVKR